MQVTYQKRDGSIMQKLRNTTPPYEVGETTSMGWKVLNIEYEYRGKYYDYYDYSMMIYKNKQKAIKKREIKEFCFKKTKSFLDFIIYFILGLIILYHIRIRL